jgi:hypothetical protein
MARFAGWVHSVRDGQFPAIASLMLQAFGPDLSTGAVALAIKRCSGCCGSDPPAGNFAGVVADG